jgi:hypothetical protein
MTFQWDGHVGDRGHGHGHEPRAGHVHTRRLALEIFQTLKIRQLGGHLGVTVIRRDPSATFPVSQTHSLIGTIARAHSGK